MRLPNSKNYLPTAKGQLPTAILRSPNMPTNTRDINDRNLTTPGLLRRWLKLHFEFLLEILRRYFFPKFVEVVDDDPHHQVFSEMLVVEILKNEFAIVFSEPDVIAIVPFQFKSKRNEK